MDYDPLETEFLILGFSQGFIIGYKGLQRRSESSDIPFIVGSELEMWQKIMKEVNAKHVTGPFDQIPLEDYIQSPIGLVSKVGDKTRLIFHLSYDFSEADKEASLNSCTPRELCTVKYHDLNMAVWDRLWLVEALKELKSANIRCMEELIAEEEIYHQYEPYEEYALDSLILPGKTDPSSGLRVLPLLVSCFCWLVF